MKLVVTIVTPGPANVSNVKKVNGMLAQVQKHIEGVALPKGGQLYGEALPLKGPAGGRAMEFNVFGEDGEEIVAPDVDAAE